LLARWERGLSVASSLSFQIFYDHAERDEYFIGQTHDVFDIELQQRATLGERHDIVWGLGYRSIADAFDDTLYIAASPDSDRRERWSAFLQDDINLIPDELKLTLGAKFEHNDYTGFEVQPNARLLWKPNERSSLWSAISRAVRTPSRVERSGDLLSRVILPGEPTTLLPENVRLPVPLLVVATRNPGFESETMTAYEIGYRVSPSNALTIDAAAFYNDYDNLRTIGDVPIDPKLTPSGYAVLALPWGNGARGHSYGFELAAEYTVADWWRLPLAYSYLELDLETPSGSLDSTNHALARTDPRQQLSLRSLMSPRENVDIDLWLRYVDEAYPDIDLGPFGTIRSPAYWELDVRLAWRPRRGLELSLVGQNLLHETHLEGYQATFGGQPVEVQRGVYGAVRIDF
jgi:iron complex outermembrane receptor protein